MGGASRQGGSEDREEKKIPSYSKQFQTNYKVTKSGEVKKKLIKPIIAATPTGSALMSFADEQNYKRRLKFAEKKGLNLLSKSKEYVTSPAAKSYLDEFGYADTLKDKTGINNSAKDKDSDNQNKPILQAGKFPNQGEPIVKPIAPSNAEVSQAQSTSMTQKDILLANKKKGRTDNILTASTGLGNNNLVIKKKKLGAA